MKKILFIANNNVGSGLSGGDRIFLNFLKYWQDKADITIFASQETLLLLKRYQIKKIKIIITDQKINSSNDLSLVSLFAHLTRRTTLGLYLIIKHRRLVTQFDFIYSVSDFYPDFFPAFLAKMINPKAKWIAGYYLFAASPFAKDFPYQGLLFFKGLFYWLMQRPSYFIARHFADIVFVTSKPDQSKFKQATYIIQGGVDLKPSTLYFNSQKTTKKIYDSVFIGRLHSQKGVLELIDIWKLVVNKMPKAKLALIGNGQLEKEVRTKIRRYKLQKNIDMLGFLEGEKKYQIFKKSKIVLHPATYDSGGMAAAEAMAWGLPGVSFDLESLQSYYPQGMLKSSCFDLKSFVENIMLLLTNENEYLKNSKLARQLIVDNWDWSKKSTDLFKQIIKYN